MKSVLLLLLFVPCAVAQSSAPANLLCVVTDSLSGKPVSSAVLSVADHAVVWHSDDDGLIRMSGLPAGALSVHISAPGFHAQTLHLTLAVGDNLLAAKLSMRLEESVNISANDSLTVNGAVSETNFNQADLQRHTMVAVSDPLRALSGLPGVTNANDFSSRLNLRGAPAQRVGFFIEGILIETPVHSVNEQSGGGSLSSLNADTVGRVTLLPGVLPASFAQSSAGAIAFELRDGQTEKPGGKLTTSFLNTSALLEGPLARSRGAWLVSLRRSHLGYFLNRIGQNSAAFDFDDLQARVTARPRENHQLTITLLGGRTFANRHSSRAQLALNDHYEHLGDQRLVIAGWNAAFSSSVNWHTRLYSSRGIHRRRNLAGNALEEGLRNDTGVRSDLTWQVSTANTFEAGTYFRRLGEHFFTGMQPSSSDHALQSLWQYDQHNAQTSNYLQDTWNLRQSRIVFHGGLRLERVPSNGETLWLPRLSASLALGRIGVLRLGASQHAQFPSFAQRFGPNGYANLHAERAAHLSLRWEHSFARYWRTVIEFYQRHDRRLVFSLADDALRAGLPAPPDAIYRNALSGMARGLETTLHFRMNQRFTGWLSYAFARADLQHQSTAVRYSSDADQRHSFSAYFAWLLPRDVSVSAHWLNGSGFPFIGIAPGSFERNQFRLPAYSRLDLRVNKSFKLRNYSLTFTAELLNTLNHANYRQNGLGLEQTLPITPSLGMKFEF